MYENGLWSKLYIEFSLLNRKLVLWYGTIYSKITTTTKNVFEDKFLIFQKIINFFQKLFFGLGG